MIQNIYILIFLLVSLGISCTSSQKTKLDDFKYDESLFDTHIDDLLKAEKIDKFLSLRLKYFHFTLKETKTTDILQNLSYYQIVDELGTFVPKVLPKLPKNFDAFNINVKNFAGAKDSLCYKIDFENKSQNQIENIILSFAHYDFFGELISISTFNELKNSCTICLDSENILIATYSDDKRQYLIDNFTYKNLIQHSFINLNTLKIFFKDGTEEQYKF